MIFGRKRPVAEPSYDIELRAAVKRLENRSYTTYKARLKTHQRLIRRSNSWNASLIALATSTTISSVGLLVNKGMYGAGGDALMVVLAILSLVASLVVSSVNYGARSRAMEANYKKIQQISLLAETPSLTNPEARQRFREALKECEMAVDSAENHSEADYYRSLVDYKKVQGARKQVWRDSLISLAPYITLSIPVGLVVPFVIWFINGV